jgi:hypothetical protein
VNTIGNVWRAILDGLSLYAMAERGCIHNPHNLLREPGDGDPQLREDSQAVESGTGQSSSLRILCSLS